MTLQRQLLKRDLCLPGLVIASLLFALSLTPSLLPRPYLSQALLSGFIMIAGYSIGVLLVALWQYLGLSGINDRQRRVLHAVTILICAALLIQSLLYWQDWQNELRTRMGMELLGFGLEFAVIFLSSLLALVLLLLARLIRYLSGWFSRRLYRVVPQRLANVLAGLLVCLLLLTLANDLVVRHLVDKLDGIYALLDASSDVGGVPPEAPWASGSDASLVSWESLGRTGENFVTEGPRQADLESYFGTSARQPLRVYVGYRTADSVEARAQVALDELIRVRGFERSKLIIATPTGTGWHDPSAVDSLEYLHRGDTAIVTMQYSYLPSWLTLLLDPMKAKQSAAALYRAIHGYWRTLPKNNRPDLYLYGLSLGALGAETSIELSTFVSDPFQGAVLVGAPFMSTLSPLIMRNRNLGSSQWLPIIKDSSFVRFTNQENALDIPEAQWGPIRIAYIQYASDPMVFMSQDLYWREPDWLKEERATDVLTTLRWYPLVTFVQLLFDLPMADRIDRGNAHNYAARSYIDAWIEVTDPEGWDAGAVQRLKQYFKGR
jgi:uncharacterized membrane protein